jgi:iron complex outermembrane receptor protein
MSRVKIRSFIWGLAMGASLYLISNTAVAQTPPVTQPVTTGAATGQPQGGELERITVTGYLIPRVGEGPQPVLTLDRDYVSKQGSQSVEDVIGKLSGTSASFQQLFAAGNNGTPGATAPQLRGLPINATLTLVDGLRFPTHGIPYNQTNAAVDINSIPLAAIDRIEILKDGGSATYGSDAVAGVINLVIKDNYEGADLTSYFGISQRGDAEVFHDSFVAGLSKPLGSGKFSVVVGFDYFQQGAIDARDRSFTTANWGKLSSKYRNLSTGSPDSYLSSFESPTRGLIWVPTGTTGGAPALLGTRPPNSTTFTPDFWVLQPRETRWGGFIKATYAPTDWLKFYDELIISTNKETAETRNQGFSSDNGDAVFSKGGPQFGTPIYVPANNPFNSTGELLGIGSYNGKDFGPWSTESWTRVLRNTIGATIQFPWHNWFVDGSFTYGESDATYTLHNAIVLNKLQDALNGQLPGFMGQFFDPFIDAKAVSHPNQKFYHALRADQIQNDRTDLVLWQIKTGGTIVDLPSGPLTIAGGAEYRSESLIQSVDENSLHNNIAEGNFIGPKTNPRRYLTSVYGEIDVPILGEKWSFPGMRGLDAVFSYRYDDYSDFGTAGKPKIALRYRPFDDLTFRATYSEGFAAPTLAQLFGSNVLFQIQPNDPLHPQFSGLTATGVVGGNPHLQPENSYGYFAEMVWTPDAKDSPDSWWHWAHGFSFNIDWYQIEFRNQIGNVAFQTAVDAAANGSPIPGTSVIRGPNGQIQRVNTPFVNLARVLTDGIDIGFSYVTKEYNWGKLDMEFSGTYVYNYAYKTIVGSATGPRFQVLTRDDTFGFPVDFKAIGSIFYSKTVFGTDTFRTGLTGHYLDSQADFINDSKGSNPRVTLRPPKFVHEIGSWTTFDWQISYTFGAPAAIAAETAKPGFDKDGKRIIGEKAIPPVRGEGSSGGFRRWLANTTFTFGINNIWDTRAPLAIARGIGLGYDYNTVDPIQRFFYVQLEKKF